MNLKYFSIIFLFMMPLLTFGQRTLLTEDRLWSMVETHCLSQGNTYNSHYLELGQDTMIDGHIYSVLRYSQDETQAIWFDYGGYIRETPEGEVFYKRDGLPEGLIYDFGASLGDSVIVINQELIPEPINFVVTLVDSLLLDDGWHRMMVLEDDAYPGEETWIEGVGSLSGLVKSGLSAFGSACGDFDLLCTSDAGDAIYVNPEFPSCWYVYTRIGNVSLEEQLLLYPNPVQDQLHIEGEFLKPGENFLVRISDYSGRIIMEDNINGNTLDVSHFSSGLYFLTIQSEAGSYTGKIMKH